MQQVNLYTQELKPQKVILPLSHMALGLSALLVLLVVVFFVFRAKVVALEARVPAKQQTIEQLQQQVSMKEGMLSGMQQDESLVSNNEALKKQVSARRQLMSMLDSVVTADGYPFSSLMTGLARQRVDHLWLTRIQFANGGATVGLQGKALQADAVPHYLQMLRGETLLLGRSFDLFQLSTDEEQDEILHFTLSSSLLNKEVE